MINNICLIIRNKSSKIPLILLNISANPFATFAKISIKPPSILVYKYDVEKKDFVIDNAYNNKIINYRLKQFKAKKINNLFAYITIDNKNAAPTFKIMDLRDTTKKSQKGSRCIDKQKGQIIKYYETISSNKIETKKKEILCNDLELLFRRKDLKDPSKLWLLNNLEYELYLMLN